ncbi:hypothetical protein L0F63_000412 [Massospora cicadina]|nr:hypothetical protein L0F63_000412 [Massospora cicadina]
MLTSKVKISDESIPNPDGDFSTKKVRFQLDPDLESGARNKISRISKVNSSHGVLAHPIRIKPLGNFYLREGCDRNDISWRRRTLGNFDALTDELILKLLEMLRAPGNRSPGSGEQRRFVETYLYLQSLLRAAFYPQAFSYPNRRLLFRHFVSALVVCVDWHRFLFGKENIERRSNLSLEDFINEYEIPNKPVIITDAINGWEAYRFWTEEKLVELYGNVKFRAEAIDIQLKRYFDYSHQTLDESPVYLFDKGFGDKCPSMLSDFDVPIYFRDDLFQLLGNDRRPDYRWLIIGPARSGSTFHKDPNATSAWNAVISGAKKWIMFPPNFPPPGVYTNKDESEVTSPVSIMEWHLNYYQEAVNEMDVKPIEAICRAGEIMFVPSGWWHLVVNLEDSIAITQNYVSHQNAEAVLNFMYHKPDQVSGWRFDPSCAHEEGDATPGDSKRQTLFDAFSEAYEKLNPELVAKIKSNRSKANPAPTFWDKLTTQDEEGFKFGFCASDEASD